ncbi:MAG: redox-sensing transcriptional repressor Rex [Rhodothermaceae bacterium]
MVAIKNHVTRLSKYKSILKRLKSVGMNRVFAESLADAANVNSAQLRKDFSIFGITGNKKGGYQIDILIEKIEFLLGKSKNHPVVLVGCGNLGTALSRYSEFEKENISIVAGFDIDETKLENSGKFPVYHSCELNNFIREHKIEIGILAVPAAAAQSTFDIMVEAGIKGVLNFSSMVLRSPSDVFVNNIDLEMALETIIFYTNSPVKDQV